MELRVWSWEHSRQPNLLRKLEYLICWKGYRIKEDKWRLSEDVKGVKGLITEFHQRNPEAPQHISTMLCPITLTWLCWQISASSEPVTPPALVPPWNSSAIEAPLSQLHTDSRDSRNLVLRSNSGITNTTLNITVSSLVPVPVPVPNLVPVPIPCSDIAFLCFPCCTHRFPVFRSKFCYVPVPNGYVLWLIYIDPHLVLYSTCLNIDFDYCSHCLLNLWSLPTSISIIWFPTLGIPSISDIYTLEISDSHNPNPGSIGNPLYSEFHPLNYS